MFVKDVDAELLIIRNAWGEWCNALLSFKKSNWR
jgi:hypothetical protein